MSIWHRSKPIILGCSTFSLILLMFWFPYDTIRAALIGVEIWWTILLPALLPFLVLAEMLLGFGIVHFFGTLLDPFMRPIYRVPGHGGFVMALGFASGYPVAAKLTAQLWEQKLITQKEGERIVSFCTTSDPIFMISAVSVGFFHQPQVAAILVIAHYGGAILLGILLGLPSKKPPLLEQRKSETGIWKLALNRMHTARLQDGRAFGQLMKDALESALHLVLIIGGLVVFFSVVLTLLSNAQILTRITEMLVMLLASFHVPDVLTQAIVNGFFEVTLGAQSAGSAGSDVVLQGKLLVTAFVLAWGGLSVHAQIASILHPTPIRYTPFALARFLHGILAVALTLAVFPWMSSWL